MSIQNQQSFEKLLCSVCLESNANASIDGCDHSFCLRCIRKWAKNKNTCPLCREQFLQIKKSNRCYKVVPPPPAPQRRRMSLQNQAPLQQGRIYYVPILFSTQQLCYFFNPTSTALVSQNMHLPNMGHSIALPSFYIPN